MGKGRGWEGLGGSGRFFPKANALLSRSYADRHTMSIHLLQVDAQDSFQTYLPAFASAIAPAAEGGGGAVAIMNSFSIFGYSHSGA